VSAAGPDPSGLRRDDAPRAAAASVPAPPSRWRTRVLLPTGLLLAFTGALAWASRDTLFPGRAVTGVRVAVRSGGAASGPVAAQAAGWVEADPFPILVTALADGVVSEVPVLEGQVVAAGDVVARLVPDDARLSLERATATAQAARAERDAAEREWNNPVERTRAVAVSRARRAAARAAVDAAAADVHAADAKVREGEERLRRERAEVAGGALPEFTAIETGLRLEAERAALAAAKAAAAGAAADLEEAAAEEEAAARGLELRIEEARRREATRAAAAEAEAAEAEARLRLHRMDVRAPAAGVVQRRTATPGAKLLLDMDDPLSATAAILYDPARLQVRADVPLADAAKVGVGQTAEIRVEVLPDRVFRGEVTRVVPEADIQKNTLQVKVRLHEPAPELRPEMLARVAFHAAAGASTEARAEERVYAPERLLRRDGSGRVTAFVVEGGRARRRDVTLGGGRAEGSVEVTAGLLPGDTVLDAPADLEDGDRVSVRVEGSHGDH
jgi:HlyD family secretion protein